MAKIQIADVIEPEIFRDSMLEETTEKSRLFQSGIISQNEELDSLASGKGVTVNMPFWQDLATGSEVLSDSSSLTPAKTEQANDKAVRHLRGRAWSANDLAGALTGDDPMQVISSRVANFWARDMQKEVLIPSLTGIFASALNGTHVEDISNEDYDTDGSDDNLVSKEAILDAVAKLGDSWDSISAIAVHSVVYFRMVSLNLIDFEPLSEQDITIPRFLGREVITDDTLPTEDGDTSGTKYTTYLFGSGAIGFGEGGEPSLSTDDAVETDRDSLAGDDILIVRRHFILHPRGVAFSGDPSGVSPTKDELEDGDNWTKRYEDKNIPIVKLVTNG